MRVSFGQHPDHTLQFSCSRLQCIDEHRVSHISQHLSDLRARESGTRVAHQVLNTCVEMIWKLVASGKRNILADSSCTWAPSNRLAWWKIPFKLENKINAKYCHNGFTSSRFLHKRVFVCCYRPSHSRFTKRIVLRLSWIRHLGTGRWVGRCDSNSTSTTKNMTCNNAKKINQLNWH